MSDPSPAFSSSSSSSPSSLTTLFTSFVSSIDEYLPFHPSFSYFLPLSSPFAHYLSLIPVDSSHLLIELTCLLVIIYLFFRKPYDPRDQERLTINEEEDLLKSWKPEPLANYLPFNQTTAGGREAEIVEKYKGAYVWTAEKLYLNACSSNYLGLAGNSAIASICKDTIDKYGVGSCGPRGFYGSFDVHLKLEERLSYFFSCECSIVYSDSIACLSSIIPAFSKRGDLIVCDAGVHYGIQQGIRLSRSNVLYYKHNDMNDLIRILEMVREKDLRSPPTKLNRRFIICEGIYQNYGDITPLAQLVALKNKYKYRLILDDTHGVGVLGVTGRGSIEHAGLNCSDVEFLCGSLDTSFATVGAYCCASRQIIDHQRLSGSGYIYSAASPPYTAAAGILSLEMIEKQPQLGAKLRENSLYTRRLLLAGLPSIFTLTPQAQPLIPSPIIHIKITQPSISTEEDEMFLLELVKRVKSKYGVWLHVPESIAGEREPLLPSLCILITAEMREEELNRIASSINIVAKEMTEK